MQHLRHDVAVLKLASPATLGGKINTICLPSHGSRVRLGTTCYVTGKVFVFRYIKRCFFLIWCPVLTGLMRSVICFNYRLSCDVIIFQKRKNTNPFEVLVPLDVAPSSELTFGNV